MSRQRKEKKIQDNLILYLKDRDWLVERMIGNAYQIGIPDLYLFNRKWGERWVDVKVEGEYSFTKAQKLKWPIWESFGVGIWILTGSDQANYNKLFQPPNWRDYWKSSWGEIPNIDELIEEMNATTTD